MFKEETPQNIRELLRITQDKTDYNKRLKAIDELGKWKCLQSTNRLMELMKHDKVYSVKQNVFLRLQQFGESVKLPKKKKGHLIKDINKKLLKVYNGFQSDSYTITDFKIKFKETYPEAYDVYLYEKNTNFDNWIQSVIKHSSMKRLKNLYHVQIVFKSIDEVKEIYSDNIGYKGSVGKTDLITISNREISISAERSAIIDPKNILDNDSNTIHTQIIKSLLFYYLYNKKFVEIEFINIKREKSKVLQEYILPNPDTKLSQVLDTTFKISDVFSFDTQQLASIFENDEKSFAIFNATSYLLKANTTNESSGKFEKLWKAFNSIYRYFGNGKNENDCHQILRKFIITNENIFSTSTNKAQLLNKGILRNKLRLRDLILNDYATKNLTVTFLSFIFRYSDQRICELLKETLVYREDYLKDIFSIDNVESRFNRLTNITSLYNACKNNPSDCIYKKVTDHLNNNINNNTSSNIELITFICIKYAYYVRNKLFHGEKHDLSFRFIDNKLTEELDWINDILETLILELIKSNHSWIQEP